MREEYKGYVILPVNGNPRSIEIKNAKQGGSLPVKLSGIWSDRGVARQAIDMYVVPKTKE